MGEKRGMVGNKREMGSKKKKMIGKLFKLVLGRFFKIDGFLKKVKLHLLVITSIPSII